LVASASNRHPLRLVLASTARLSLVLTSDLEDAFYWFWEPLRINGADIEIAVAQGRQLGGLFVFVLFGV
jgi:hypothetical protein